MEFKVLGPLEMRRGGCTVALPGGKPRAVLAVLLLHANEPVSAERLAVALWGQDDSARRGQDGAGVCVASTPSARRRRAAGDQPGGLPAASAAGRARPRALRAAGRRRAARVRGRAF